MADYNIYYIDKAVGYTRRYMRYDGSDENITEIAKQKVNKFNECFTLVSIRKERKIIKGIPRTFFIDYHKQHSLAQLTMWGYIREFNEYSKYIRDIAFDNGLDTVISDDYIKYFYTNKVASVCPKEGDMRIYYSAYGVVNFLDKIYDGNRVAKTNLANELKSLAMKKAKVQLDAILRTYPNIDKSVFIIDKDNFGTYIKSDVMKVYFVGNQLSKNIQLFSNNKFVGTVKQEEL